ncbi:MAG: divergent PAP2 family protein [Candidatus Kerfeldbacteria bacterium]|nr:divergent PAP2 family protein [Candidatus Kerfeldbacteria bacterium]
MEFPKIVLIPILSGLIAQLSKLLVETVRSGSADLRVINRYGGMPSSHTALVVSLTTVIGLMEGLSSAAFAVAIIFSLVTVRDAIGFRMYLGEHAHILNKLIEDLPAREKPRFPKHIIERIGHTPAEAMIGALIGIASTLILWFILP